MGSNARFWTAKFCDEKWREPNWGSGDGLVKGAGSCKQKRSDLRAHWVWVGVSEWASAGLLSWHLCVHRQVLLVLEQGAAWAGMSVEFRRCWILVPRVTSVSQLLSRLISLLSFTAWFLTTYSNSCFARLYPLSRRTPITQLVFLGLPVLSCQCPAGNPRSPRQSSHGRPAAHPAMRALLAQSGSASLASFLLLAY